MSELRRVVPDTNVIIGLGKSLSSGSPHRIFFNHWQNGEFDLLYSQDTLYEFAEKLNELGIRDHIVIKLLSAIIEVGVEVYIETFHLRHYPVDPEDIAFLLCAVNGDATHLITSDRHLLVLAHLYPFRICTTLDFLNELGKLADTA